MLIDISDIGPQGLSLSGRVPLERITVDGNLEARLEAPSMELRLEPTDRGVALTAHIETRVLLTCVRCLGVFEQDLSHDFSLILSSGPSIESTVAGSEGEERGVPGDEDDIDVYPVEGKTVDMTEVVREQVDLCLPMKPVCRTDCKGLCASCGADLNKERCDCPAAPNDPRWAGLAALQGSKGKP